MKTIVCGPPHSGKSVLISNLVKLMPSDSFQRITANGDGEGTWSNNPNQMDVMSVRHKSSNSPQEFANWKRRIETAIQDIVLIDIGGRLQDDKGPLFDAADSFIILSSDPELTPKWKTFGESHNCRCIAIIESSLTEQECVFSTNPYLHARISGLERGNKLIGSIVLSALAECIVENSCYKHTQVIDLYDIGKKLGCSKSWFTHTGVEVSNVFFTTDKAAALYDYLVDTYSPIGRYKLNGAKVNWVACIASTCLCTDNVSDISFYDEWTDTYINPAILEQTEDYSNSDLDISIKETETAILLSFVIKSVDLDANNFTNYKLPKIDTGKALYISGRFPNWFTVSVLKSYSNKEKYLHQPGIGYYCVESSNKKYLGNLSTLFVQECKQ